MHQIIDPRAKFSGDELRCLAAAVEMGSEHSLGRAIVRGEE